MAKKTKKRQTAKQQAINKAYAKERNRIRSFVRRAEKRGYSFPESIVPSIPKRKTEASIRKLKKLTKEMLYSKASYAGEATYGEIVSGKEGLKLERQLRAKRAAETRKEKKEAEQRFWTSTDGTKTPVTDEPALAYAEAFNDLVDKLKEIISTMDVYYYTSVTGKRVRRSPNVAETANSALNEILATLDVSETHYDCTTFTLIFIQRRHKSIKYYNKCIYTFCCNIFCSYILCIIFVVKIKNRALWKLRLYLERLLPRRILLTVRKKQPTWFRTLCR